ncbi:hypothetical protein LOTGIDRAFT_146834, partial [Lottia gigantea]
SLPAAEAEPGTLKTSLAATPRLDKMTEKSAPDENHKTPTLKEIAETGVAQSVQPANEIQDPIEDTSKAESASTAGNWVASPEWVQSWKQKLPLQTIMRMLQVLVPQVEKICIDKGLTDESEILKFLQHGTLVGLLPVPHPILIRKYQANSGTTMWFRTYLWGVIYLRFVIFIVICLRYMPRLIVEHHPRKV